MSTFSGQVKILLWNIQAASAARSAPLAAGIRELNPDVIVLNEVHSGQTNPLLADLQSERSETHWAHALSTNPPEKLGGVAVLAREPLVDRRDVVQVGRDVHRYLPVEIPSASLLLWAVYAPYDEGCDVFWEPLHTALRADAERPTVLIGDLNAGLDGDIPATTCLAGMPYAAALKGIGYVDLWRQTHPTDASEPSWHSTRNPFRIDHAFGSRAAAERVVDATYRHEGREQKLSDHSALLLTLRLD